MTPRRPIVETRQRSTGFRRTPEQILIDCEDGDGLAAEARAERHERDRDRQELTEAFVRYARRHGWAEAKGWAAARAFYDPMAAKGSDPRAAAERAFKKARAA
jgi:hypothetical protein